LIAALVLLGIAGYFVYRYVSQSRGPSEKAFFYDLSEKKLFKGPRQGIPPIRGLNDAEEDAMRAVVVSTNGNPSDAKSWNIAYLEKYSPELKKQMEKAQVTGVSPEMSRELALQHRFVRRLTDSNWFPMNSPQAERIVTDWAIPGPNGVTPVVCAP
jgi:hypothetical protein